MAGEISDEWTLWKLRCLRDAMHWSSPVRECHALVKSCPLLTLPTYIDCKALRADWPLRHHLTGRPTRPPLTPKPMSTRQAQRVRGLVTGGDSPPV